MRNRANDVGNRGPGGIGAPPTTPPVPTPPTVPPPQTPPQTPPPP